MKRAFEAYGNHGLAAAPAICYGMSMFEHKKSPLLPWPAFLRRVAKFLSIVLLLTGCALLIGMIGYHSFEGYDWIDAFLNAAMILGGMGQVDPIKTEAGKIFSGCYALFSGLWFVSSMGLLLAPVFHRILHRVALEAGDGN